MDLEPSVRVDVVRALVYAVQTSFVESKTTQRLIVQEFVHSLNRKGRIKSEDVDEWLQLGYALIEEEKESPAEEGLGALFG